MHPDKKCKTTLNYIEKVPSTGTPSSSESDMVVPLQAITRAQARAPAEKGKRKVDEEIETEAAPSENTKKSKETWKERRARRAASKKRRAKKEQAAIHETTQQNLERQPEKSKNNGPKVTA